MDEDLDPRETARVRRRDHDRSAKERDLLRPGMGKVFKQITDGWARDADEPQKRQKPAKRASTRQGQ